MNLMKLSPGLKMGIIGVLLIVFFVVLNLTSFSKEAKNFFYVISSPIQKTFWRAGDNISDFFEVISKTKKLKAEVDELELKIEELTAENARLKELKKENEVLREALGVSLEKEFKLLPAEVTGKEISQDFILINKGAKDGISRGLPVITQQKSLIGKIGEVYKNFSKVILISNEESSFDAKISETAIQGVVKGNGNLKLYLDLIPHEKEIKEGDLVVTTALGGIFPSGLLVGIIEEILKSDIHPFQKAKIFPFFNLKEIEILFIITETR